MKKQTGALLLILITGVASAQSSFLEEIEEHIQDQQIFPESRYDIEDFDFGDINPETEQLKSDIFWEEDALDQIEQKLRESEVNLWTSQNKRRGLDEQIFLLDQEIALVTTQLQEYEQRENYHRTFLERLTKEKSYLEALIRVRKRILQKTAIRNYLRRSNKRHSQIDGLPNQNVFMTQWLFSDHQLSDVIETYRQEIEQEEQSKKEIAELESLQIYLSQQEQVLAYQTGISERLTDQITTQERRLKTFTEAQAELRKRFYNDEETQQQLVAEYRQQQNQSTITLQELRLQLKNTPLAPGTIEAPEKQDFIYPVQTPIRITAYFHDQAYEERFGLRHDGVDFAIPQGSPILAIGDGKVVDVKDNGLGYSYLIVEHPDDTFSLYGHISGFLVRPGEDVRQGQSIALSGGTPGTRGAGFFTTGPHLHFELFKNGEYVNPLRYINQ